MQSCRWIGMTAGQGYHLYVIELDPSAPRRRATFNRGASPDATSVYVGESWYPPEVPKRIREIEPVDLPIPDQEPIEVPEPVEEPVR